MSLYESADLGENVTLLCKDSNCTVYKLQDSTGEGMMTAYEIYPGINLLFNDFHIDCCMSYFRPGTEIFCIDHCREGRLEWELEDGSFLYTEAGDLQLNSRDHHQRMFRFPLRHYHGITISFCIEEAAESLAGVLEGFDVDLRALSKKFCAGRRPFIMRAGAVDHIFSELYCVAEPVRNIFFKIKVLELLLFLRTLEVPENSNERPYFYKSQVEKARAIMELITGEPQRYYTLEELSERFLFPITSMKRCFKGVYGSSIYAYMKAYRMNTAAVMLRRTEESITSIALKLGYDNASKFSAAFKSVIGMTPSEYRRTGEEISNEKNVRMESCP
ncbi:MAG: transcriptional regulator, AraC family [Bacillota bacterium]|jgi:AraC-like DNA-binding protein|nr:transcriptional regulator, AraC family [Bacillota bacterium]